MFTRKSANAIFKLVHVEGWIFDIEVLIIAKMYKMPIKEVAVNWREIEGSKLSVLRDSVKMLVDLLVIRVNYLLRFWSIEKRIKSE